LRLVVPSPAERLENHLLRCSGIPIPVSSTVKATTLSAVQALVVAAPSLRGRPHLEVNVALIGELNELDRRLRITSAPLRVGVNRRRQVFGELDLEIQPLVLGDLPEIAIDIIAQVSKGTSAILHLHGAGLDLGQIQYSR